MKALQIISIALVLLSVAVVGAGFFAIGYYANQNEPIAVHDARWENVEATVEKDIGKIGYQFLTHGKVIPAIDAGEYERCFADYADLTTVDNSYTLEYLFKYNQIVRLRLMRAGISC